MNPTEIKLDRYYGWYLRTQFLDFISNKDTGRQKFWDQRAKSLLLPVVSFRNSACALVRRPENMKGHNVRSNSCIWINGEEGRKSQDTDNICQTPSAQWRHSRTTVRMAPCHGADLSALVRLFAGHLIQVTCVGVVESACHFFSNLTLTVLEY